MLIDSNILIYAINADSQKHELAKRFLKANINDLEVSHQNILETLRVITHTKFPNRFNTKEAIKAIHGITEACRLVVPNKITYHIAVELISEHNLLGNRIFDAYLAATALSNDIDVIATDNVRDMGKFEGIKVINPFAQKLTN